MEVAITGRLASMSREEAVARLEANGHDYVEMPTEATHRLVIGQEGWPLSSDGHLTKSIEYAHALRDQSNSIEIITEEVFLAMIGLEERQGDFDRLYTTDQLSRILEVSAAEIRSWVRKGLIEPARRVGRLCYFEFRQVASARGLHALLAGGATASDVRRSLERLRSLYPDTEASISQLEAIEHSGQILVRLDSGRLAEPNGQLHLEFDSQTPASTPSIDNRIRPTGLESQADVLERWFLAGVEAEERQDYEDAIDAYHQAMLHAGPQAEIAFNIGNCLYSLGRAPEAVQRYMMAVELEPDYVEAWNNLGTSLAELNLLERATTAYVAALHADPHYPDAHFNLADTLEHLDQLTEAREHWVAYLKQNPGSHEDAHVRERIAMIDAPPAPTPTQPRK